MVSRHVQKQTQNNENGVHGLPAKTTNRNFFLNSSPDDYPEIKKFHGYNVTLALREVYGSIGSLKLPLSRLKRTIKNDIKRWDYRALCKMENDIQRNHYNGDRSLLVFSSPSLEIFIIGKISN